MIVFSPDSKYMYYITMLYLFVCITLAPNMMAGSLRRDAIIQYCPDPWAGKCQSINIGAGRFRAFFSLTRVDEQARAPPPGHEP